MKLPNAGSAATEENMEQRVEEHLRREQVLAVAGCSRATLDRWCATGLFPQPVRLGPNSIGWKRSEVEAWSANRPIATRKPIKKAEAAHHAA